MNFFMEKIYSLIEPGVLLHAICRKEDISLRREDFASPNEFLQVAALILKKGEEVKAHKHLDNSRTTSITQESIVVIEGAIEANFYDLNNSLIKTIILNEGDCCVTFRGGHFFKALEENTKFYEIKNGPYEGREKDKVGI